MPTYEDRRGGNVSYKRRTDFIVDPMLTNCADCQVWPFQKR